MNDEKDEKWIAPGRLAICRNLAGGSLAAGVLLYRIAGLWAFREKKLERFNMKWIAMSRAEWARSAGLSLNEYDRVAMRGLKKHCSEFVTVRTMKLTRDGDNKVWISLDAEAMADAMTPWDMYEPMLNGKGIYPKAKKYPPKKGEM